MAHVLSQLCSGLLGALGSVGGRLDIYLLGFERPAWLLLIPLLLFMAWWIARRSLAGWEVKRRLVHLAVRCAVIVLLCMVLAEPRFLWRASDVAVVVVMDVSDSIPHDQRRLAEDFVESSLAARGATDRFGLVSVARYAHVQSLPSTTARSTFSVSVGPSNGSNLQSGVDLAKLMVPSDAAGRVLLISDGNETSGRLSDSASRLLTAGVPLDVASVAYDRSGMVRVESVVAPSWVRAGEIITARVILSAGRATSGRLMMLIDGVPVDLDPDSPGVSARVTLRAGVQAFTQQLRLPGGPVHRIEAVFEPDDGGDSIPGLLRAEAVTFTSDLGRVLVLTDDASASEALVSSFSSEHVRVDVLPAISAPQSLEDWSGYDALVLVDQPASNFSRAQQLDMKRAVHDAGMGLLLVGGPNSYGAGGWMGSVLADAFPVLLDPPQKRQMPMGALALVIDSSGSMSMPVSGTNMSQQQIANEAATLGVRTLSRLDQVTVISFDSSSRVVVPLTVCSDPEGISRRIRAISPGGGTNLFPAMELAESELNKSPAGVKHIIILSDGVTIGDPNHGLAIARRLRNRGITISTVAIGDASNDPLLAALAVAGGGRNHNVSSANARAELPQIFTKEAQTIRRALIWEGPGFSPDLSAVGESLSGIRGPFPATTGYVVTADRGGLSSVALRGPEGDPLLAHWQHGLGRVTAFTSDATTRWNAGWHTWGSFGAFWGQQIKWVMRPSSDANVNVTLDVRGDKALIALDMLDPAGERVNFAAIRARLSRPSGVGDGREAAHDVSFRQVGPGRYEAEVELSDVGSHLLSLRYEAGARESDGSRGLSGSVRTAIVRPAGEEHRHPGPNLGLLREVARRTNGRELRLDDGGADLWAREGLQMPELSRPIWLLVAVLACGMFLMDVAARRIAIDFARLRSTFTGLWSASPRKTAGTLSTLADVKARAGETMRKKDARPAQETWQPAAGDVETAPIPLVSSGPGGAKSSAASPADGTAADGQESGGGDVMSRLQAAKKRSQRGMTNEPGE